MTCTMSRIDNNEMAGMVDGHARFRGQVGMWGSRLADVADNVEKRMGWGGGVARVGSVGKAANTMGMARASISRAEVTELESMS